MVGGEEVPVPLPRNRFKEDKEYTEQAPDLPPQPPVVTPGVAQPPALGSAPAPLALAAEAALDWMETHGGEVRVSGPTANLSILADATAWSTRFLPTCGRLLPFLRRFGVSSGDLDVFKGIDLGKSD